MNVFGATVYLSAARSCRASAKNPSDHEAPFLRPERSPFSHRPGGEGRPSGPSGPLPAGVHVGGRGGAAVSGQCGLATGAAGAGGRRAARAARGGPRAACVADAEPHAPPPPPRQEAVDSFLALNATERLRIRGYQVASGAAACRMRSIPADAGLPGRQMAHSPWRGVYPRGCGATSARAGSSRCFRGLSPRMRGYLFWARNEREEPGSIPADAGLPVACAIRDWTARVYPRGCGATTLNSRVSYDVKGLSPRMRGYRSLGARLQRWQGSIPADAGLPRRRVRWRRPRQVYPRGCGATPATVCQEPGATGPSLRISPRKDDSLSQGRTAPSTKERHGPDATIVLASGRRRCAAGTWDAVTAPCATPPKPPALVPATCRSS